MQCLCAESSVKTHFIQCSFLMLLDFSTESYFIQESTYKCEKDIKILLIYFHIYSNRIQAIRKIFTSKHTDTFN